MERLVEFGSAFSSTPALGYLVISLHCTGRMLLRCSNKNEQAVSVAE